MEGTTASTPLSWGNLSDNLDSALLDLTNELTPGYAPQIQDSDPCELKGIMSELVCHTMNEKLKDKAWAKMNNSNKHTSC